jgi:hypothetical protein
MGGVGVRSANPELFTTTVRASPVTPHVKPVTMQIAVRSAPPVRDDCPEFKIPYAMTVQEQPFSKTEFARLACLSAKNAPTGKPARSAKTCMR